MEKETRNENVERENRIDYGDDVNPGGADSGLGGIFVAIALGTICAYRGCSSPLDWLEKRIDPRPYLTRSQVSSYTDNIPRSVLEVR